VQSSNFTAAVGLRYVTTATLTITDPTGSSAGQSYEVIVGGGTTTLGGVAYTASGVELVRYYNGSAWTTLSTVLPGTNVTAPNQGTTATNGLVLPTAASS
jgi:hypothetical protein